VLASDLNMHYARIAYQLPVGEDGLKLGAAYADTRYQLGKEFAALLAHGSATNVSVYGTYPLVRTPSSQLTSALTWESKKLLDETGAPVTSASKQVRLVNLGLTASEQDTLALVLSGQKANKNLGSSEKYSLGGASGVRAYPQGEGNGDEGWLANLELRHSWTSQLQGLVFYDLGSVSVNHRPFAATPNLRDIAGAGLGLNAQFGSVQLKAAVAWRTQGGPAQSEPATINGNPRLWIQASGQF
jgi:hemolysin activation/secretion protein